jgi:Domain of unknown function (DUF4388)
MSLSGYLSEYSLAEILQFIQQDNRTGLLTVIVNGAETGKAGFTNYTWFQRGQIIANAKDLKSLGLITLIEKRNWVGAEVAEKLRTTNKFLDQPLGIHLKSINLLDVEQLRILFHVQVFQGICELFKLSEAKFQFDDLASVNYIKAEMTGLQVSAAEISLCGMRVLQDWTYLERKLPAPEYGLQRLRDDLPEYKLDNNEIRMINLADGCHSITEIASELSMSVNKAQKIAFRLISVALLREIALNFKPSITLEKEAVFATESISVKTSAPAVSKSFLNNLVGFLKKQK